MPREAPVTKTVPRSNACATQPSSNNAGTIALQAIDATPNEAETVPRPLCTQLHAVSLQSASIFVTLATPDSAEPRTHATSRYSCCYLLRHSFIQASGA